MVKVQKQALTTIKKSQPKKIVVDEGSERAEKDIEQAEAPFATGDHHFSAERRVAVHVVDVLIERGVGMVDERASKPLRWSMELNILMNGSVLEPASSPTEQA